MLDSEQLNVVTKRAEGKFEQLKTKHAGLKAFLVFSSTLGQVDLDASLRQILQQFPEMIVASKAKNDGLKILAELKKAEKDDKNAEVERLGRQLALLAPQIRFDESTRIEIRFKDLKFNLAWALQTDEHVDRDLTPQTKASIRIVLGTLSTLGARQL